jgi:hypothetical protein
MLSIIGKLTTTNRWVFELNCKYITMPYDFTLYIKKHNTQVTKDLKVNIFVATLTFSSVRTAFGAHFYSLQWQGILPHTTQKKKFILKKFCFQESNLVEQHVLGFI